MLTSMLRDSADGYRALLAEVYELAGRSRRQSDLEAAAHGSTAARWQTMSAISDGDLTVAAIARRLGLPRQAQAHVQKLPNPDHARAELISLTEEGRTVLHQLWRESDRHRLELVKTADLSEQDLATAREVLKRLVAAFQQTQR
jgi:DNA-binding MarR family transcriptional regulator